MSGISLTAVEQMPDVLGTWRFELSISPAKSSSMDMTKAFKLRCQQVDFSGVQIEPVTVALHGHELQFRGRQQFAKTVSITFVETVDAAIIKALHKWKETVVGLKSGNGAYRSSYAAMGELKVLDVTGKPSTGQTIFYMWPSDIPNVQLDGTSSTAFMVQVTFTYDFVQIDEVEIDTDGEAVTM